MQEIGFTIKTGVDKLVDLVRERKRISIDEAAKILSVPKVLVEEWADFLDEREVIGIEYKFAVPYLVYKEMTRSEVEERAKQFAGRREGFVRKVDSTLQFLEQQSESIKRLKDEFAAMSKELEAKVEHVKGELDMLHRYDEMKRAIDSQILEQQNEFEEKRRVIEEQILSKKKAIGSMLKQIDTEGKRLGREEALVRLMRKDEEALEKELQAVVKKAQLIEDKIRFDDSLISEAVQKITDFKELSEKVKVEMQKQEEVLTPLLVESRKHEEKIAELKRQFLEKVAGLAKDKSGLKPGDAKAIQAKFEKFFAKKLAAESLVKRVTDDLEGLKNELRELSQEAMVVQLTSKSKKVADYVKEFEQKFNLLNERKEKFQGEVFKLAHFLKKV